MSEPYKSNKKTQRYHLVVDYLMLLRKIKFPKYWNTNKQIVVGSEIVWTIYMTPLNYFYTYETSLINFTYNRKKTQNQLKTQNSPTKIEKGKKAYI